VLWALEISGAIGFRYVAPFTTFMYIVVFISDLELSGK
jgi:hypothetical protein